MALALKAPLRDLSLYFKKKGSVYFQIDVFVFFPIEKTL